VKSIAAILLTIHCLTLGAGDIRLPMRSVEVTPDPVSETRVEPVDTIRADEWYVIESDGPLFVLTSPTGILEVESIAGPMTFRGRFAGGDKIETRTFSGPHLHLVTALKPGKAEVIVIPQGVTCAEDIIRQVLTVSGQGPKPPPDDDPIPPDGDPIPAVKNVSLAIVEDTMNRSPDTAILMNQLVAWTEFVDAGNDWRAYDLKTGESRGKQAITDLNGPVPGLVIYEKSTRKMIHRGDLPGTFSELKSLVGRLTGG
jgi:hypothetical protein